MIAVSRDLGWMMLILLLPMSFVSLPNYSPENQFVWESDSDPASFDPHTDLSSYDARILYNIYETLYTYPWNKNEAEPLLPLLAAEPPSITADGRNYTVRLRQEIKFHDNTPFNASCVKWNIERAMKIFHLNGSISLLAEALRDGWQMQEAAAINGTSSDTFKAAFDNWVENSSSIEAINTYEVRFILEDAYTPFIHLLAHPLLSMMSPTYVLSNSNDDRGPMGSHWGVEYGEVHTYMETYTCGTGPYMLTEWRQNEFIRLDLFEDYWRSFAAEPFITPPAYAGSIEKIWYKTNSDKTGRLLNLRTGLADVVDWPTANALEVWDNVTLSSKAPDINASIALSFDLFFLGFNFGNLTAVIDSSTITVESPFENRYFRRAASFAFNYQEFIESRLDGFGKQAKGPIPEGMPGHNDSSFTVELNITEAVEQWNLAMQDPQFVDSLNSLNDELTFHHIADSGGIAETILKTGLDQMYAHPNANRTGLNNDVDFNLEPLTASDYWQYLKEDRLLVVSSIWSPDIAHSTEPVRDFCYHMGEWAKGIGYNNSDINNWYNLALLETNPTEQNQYYNLIQERVSHDSPFLWTSQFEEFLTWRIWLKGGGLTYNPMHGIYIYETHKPRPALLEELSNQRAFSSTIELLLIGLLFLYVVVSRLEMETKETCLRTFCFAIFSVLSMINVAVIFQMNSWAEEISRTFRSTSQTDVIPFLIAVGLLVGIMCLDIYMKEEKFWTSIILVCGVILLLSKITYSVFIGSILV